MDNFYKDWGEISELFEEISNSAFNKSLNNQSEAQTRFDIIDRIVKEILQWSHGQISVEPHQSNIGFIDYILISGDIKIIIEAKKIGATFPNPSKKKSLKLTGSILGTGEIKEAIEQAEEYAVAQKADLVIVTNGNCWCFYPTYNLNQRNEIYAQLLFPFNSPEDAETLFNYFACSNVEKGSLNDIPHSYISPPPNRLITKVYDSDQRIGSNHIADFISPALNEAIHGEALFGSIEKLKYCFVDSDSRTKFDQTLNIHLHQQKPSSIKPAQTLKLKSSKNPLADVIQNSQPSSSPPITMIIGSVGSGKSTYLKNFELVKGKKTLQKTKCHWIYIDFEEMGKGGIPRDFIYNKLNDYLLDEHPDNPTDYDTLIEPAYEEEIKALARGPFKKIFARNKERFENEIADLIKNDFVKIEPYIDKVFKYLAQKQLCVIVLDNIDLYEDENLETIVFSEGVALSKKFKTHIMASIRDTTFIKHRNSSIFNNQQLRKFWINPPPFMAVLAKRLDYGKKVLSGVTAQIPINNSMYVDVPDLSVFFDIARSSLLNGESEKLVESICNKNVRKGIELVSDFLVSGHIKADRAIQHYLNNKGEIKSLPYHEVFKGMMLGQWMFFKERRSEAFNAFDSYLGSSNLQLLRLYILKLLNYRALDQKTVLTPISDIIKIISKLGASVNHITATLNSLIDNRLVKSEDGKKITTSSILYITKTGGYYISVLTHKLVYLETILLDTAIHDKELWNKLAIKTEEIENLYEVTPRLTKRTERVEIFLNYLQEIENNVLSKIPNSDYLRHIDKISISLKSEIHRALSSSRKYYGT